MKKLLLIITFLTLTIGTVNAQGSGVFFDLTNVFLKKYVDANNKRSEERRVGKEC